MPGEELIYSDAATMWVNIWFWVMVVGGLIFLGVYVYAVVAGVKDIKELFAGLARTEEQRHQQEAAEAERPRESEGEHEARR